LWLKNFWGKVRTEKGAQIQSSRMVEPAPRLVPGPDLVGS
jgi:hypothetical protein